MHLFTNHLYACKSDIKVFVVDYESQADLVVYKTKYKSEAKGNEGIWHFVEYQSQADKKIYFMNYKSQVDLFYTLQKQSGLAQQTKTTLNFLV